MNGEIDRLQQKCVRKAGEICKGVCVCVCADVDVCVCVYVCVCIYIYIYIFICVCVYVCVHVYMTADSELPLHRERTGNDRPSGTGGVPACPFLSKRHSG